MKDVYDELYSRGKYNDKVNNNQFKWLMDRDLNGVKTAADFGCGRGHIVHALRKRDIKTIGVDFSDSLAGGNWDSDPLFVCGDVRNVDLVEVLDLVVCHDVLEHIPEEDADKTLDNLAKHTGKFASLAIANHPDVWNGKELHLIKKPLAWWQKKVAARFGIIEVEGRLGGRLHLFWCRAK